MVIEIVILSIVLLVLAGSGLAVKYYKKNGRIHVLVLKQNMN